MNMCVMCGRELPDECGSQVCRTCELTAGKVFIIFTCPECGERMEIYYKSVLDYVAPKCSDEWPYLRLGLMYHCGHCGCDWSSEYVSEFGDESQSALKRHYWG